MAGPLGSSRHSVVHAAEVGSTSKEGRLQDLRIGEPHETGAFEYRWPDATEHFERGWEAHATYGTLGVTGRGYARSPGEALLCPCGHLAVNVDRPSFTPNGA